jgi:hypothetical protein
MNPRKLPGLRPSPQQRWKLQVGEFIEERYRNLQQWLEQGTAARDVLPQVSEELGEIMKAYRGADLADSLDSACATPGAPSLRKARLSRTHIRR